MWFSNDEVLKNKTQNKTKSINTEDHLVWFGYGLSVLPKDGLLKVWSPV
jgi:hypothetical protein